MPDEGIQVQECRYEDKVRFRRKRLAGTYQHAIHLLASGNKISVRATVGSEAEASRK